MKEISRFIPEEVSEIFKKARRYLRHPGLDILCYPAKKEHGRILIVTSRKVGTAPQRNKIRRRLKAIFFEQQLFDHSLDCVVIIKKSGVDLTFEKLKQLLLEAIEKYEKNNHHS